MQDTALGFEAVTRRFGGKTAVAELDLRVEPGTVLGLLGRNGAGKTTSLRLAHGLLHADEGRIRVLGLDPRAQGLEVRQQVSLLSEESHLYPWMTVEQITEHAAALHPRWDRDLARSLGRQLELDPRALIRNLSRGSRAKVAVLLAISCRPRLLLLDDPTAGLDPLVRREVLQNILEALPAEGGSVVYASHLIHDVERIADRVAILDAGRLRLEGSLETLKQQVRRVTAIFESDAPVDRPVPEAIDWTAEGRVLSVVVRGNEGDLTASVRGLGAREVNVEPLSLEDILVACLRQGRAAEVEHA